MYIHIDILFLVWYPHMITNCPASFKLLLLTHTFVSVRPMSTHLILKIGSHNYIILML